MFSPDGQQIRIIGTKGAGDGQLSNPCALAIDKEGNIYLSDSSNNRIQKFKPDGTFVSKKEGYSFPCGIKIDGEGKIIVCERDSHRIYVSNPDGTIHSTFGSYGKGNGQLSKPTGVAINSSGQLIVCDNSNHRVQIFS